MRAARSTATGPAITSPSLRGRCVGRTSRCHQTYRPACMPGLRLSIRSRHGAVASQQESSGGEPRGGIFVACGPVHSSDRRLSLPRRRGQAPSLGAKQHLRRAGCANCAPPSAASTRTPPSLMCPRGSSALLAPHRRRFAAGRDAGQRPQQDPAAATPDAAAGGVPLLHGARLWLRRRPRVQAFQGGAEGTAYFGMAASAALSGSRSHGEYALVVARSGPSRWRV